MAFIKGFRATNGILTNEVWEFAALDVSEYDWRIAPGNDNSGYCDIGSGAAGVPVGGSMGSVKFNVPSINYSDWSTEFLLASFEIQGSQGSDYKRELRFTTAGNFISFGPETYNGSVGIKAYIRVYSDPTTYTDTLITGSPVSEVQFHRNDSSGVYSLNVYCVFANVMYNGHHKVLIGISNQQNRGVDAEWTGMYTYYDYNYFWQLLGGNVPEEDFSPEFGPAAVPEGYDGGSFNDHSDSVDFPSDPQSILGLGFINVYKCSANSLIDLGAEMFPEIVWPSTPSDVWEAVKAVSDSIWNSRLIDYVISVHCVPGDVPAGNLEAIKIGARTMQGIMGRKITSEYVPFNFGSLQTGRIFKNYADIMTGCKIFLPFYGFVPLPAEYWNGCTLTLKYKFNVIDGSFMAYLKASDCYYSKLNGIVGQYSGSAVVHMPTTGANYAAMFSNVIGSGAAMAGSMASGNVAGVASSMTSIAANIGSGGNAQTAGNYNASSSFMSMRQPFLLIELPVPQFPTKYAPEKGLPANITYVLGTLRGLVICDSPRITFACTEDEQKEIIAALQEGIII